MSRVLFVLLVLVGLSQAAGNPRGFVSQGGNGLLNWRAAMDERKISAQNVADLQQVWSYTIYQNMSAYGNTQGGFAAIPTSNGDRYLYVTDWSGMLRAFDRFHGQVLWSFNVSQWLIQAIGSRFVFFGNEYASRTSPTIDGNKLYIATRMGAYVLAFNRFNGQLLWNTCVSQHPLAYITAAVRVYERRVYVGTASANEIAAGLGFPCCTFQGQFFALDSQTGAIAWTFNALPDNGGVPGSWAGAAVWSSLAPIDEERRQIIISTGNLYAVPQYMSECMALRQNYSDFWLSDPCRHAQDYSESVVALDLDTGAVRWSRAFDLTEVWSALCGIYIGDIPFILPDRAQCPPQYLGQDYDFGQSPIFIPGGSATPDGEDALVICQKSGMCYCLSAQAGKVHWSRQLAPGSSGGGFLFGSASDGVSLYYADTNGGYKNFTLQNGQVLYGTAHIGAVDIKTGHILWQTPAPFYPGAGFDQGVVYANNVVYASSRASVEFTPQGPAGTVNNGGRLLALDATTGQIMLNVKLDNKACNPPSIVDGMLYVGCGYDYLLGGFPLPAKLYAFSL